MRWTKLYAIFVSQTQFLGDCRPDPGSDGQKCDHVLMNDHPLASFFLSKALQDNEAPSVATFFDLLDRTLQSVQQVVQLSFEVLCSPNVRHNTP